jgi:hypothetical protein
MDDFANNIATDEKGTRSFFRLESFDPAMGVNDLPPPKGRKPAASHWLDMIALTTHNLAAILSFCQR